MKMLGSSVLPDLEETMNSVLPISTACSIALICAGSVPSSMWKRGQLACCPNVLPNTSGPRLDPPIPSSTRSVNPPCFTSFAKAVSRSISASSCSTMFSQPSHLSSTVPAHSDVSPAQSRRIRPPARHRYALLDDVGCRLTVFAECIHRRRRDGVHGVAADQRLDIHRVLVGGA